jgi:predicted MPP superfamily phosphohydrolase
MADVVRLAVIGAGAVAAWGLFESQWVRRSDRIVLIPGLAPGLVGLRIAHLSDLHVGAPSLNAVALRRAIDIVVDAGPDLVCITGDLRARVAGDASLRRQLGRLAVPLGCYAVLGNHDYGDGYDPFGDDQPLTDLDDTPVRLLADERVVIEHEAGPILIGGMAPRTFSEDPTSDASGLLVEQAALRILLCHFPDVLDRLAPRAWDLVLAGHLHGGQICIPTPTGKIRLAHTSRDYLEGIYGREGTALHVSRGVGTTFVPVRIAARPEVAILELAAAAAA